MGIALVATVTLALAPLTALTSVARAEDDVYDGGALTGLAFDSGYTNASFQDVSYHYEGCGTNPAEKTCVWQVHVQLYSDPSRRCVPTTPELTAIWDSARISGNGEVHSGARQFALEGCPGQVLSGWFEMTKTFDPEKEEGQWKVLSSGGQASLFRIAIGDESVRHTEESIAAANPPAQPEAPPSPLTIAVSRDCRRLKIDRDHYAFSFSRIGCRKATNLVSMYLRSGASPSGYACRPRPTGVRCNRLGHPEKYVAWSMRKRA